MAQSYIVSGAGCFGTSTAWWLKKSYPEAKVILIDRMTFPSELSAAFDYNKILRSAYESPLYMELALEAMNEWMTNPILEKYFHQTRLLFAGTEGPGKAIIKNYEALRLSSAELLDPETAKDRFPAFRNGDWKDVTTCTLDHTAGWADAADALRAVIKDAIKLGVEYVTATVTKLKLEQGKCTGVVLKDGKTLHADKVVLAAGAHIPWLLAESAPDRPEVHAGDRLIAAAAVMGTFRVPPDQAPKLEDAPIFVNPIGQYPAECIPFGAPELVKCTNETTFTHIVFHKASGEYISVPPAAQQAWSLDIPEGLKNMVQEAQRKQFGVNMQPEQYRVCWDAITPNQGFVVSPHPHVPGLYLVTGGSFHGFKFLSTIGKYAVRMLKGDLPSELAEHWAWNRKNEGANCASYAPKRDLSEVPGYGQWATIKEQMVTGFKPSPS